MKSDLPRVLITTFLIALVLYVASFKWIQYKRESKGPWNVTFATDAAGTPSLTILQPALNIQNVQITFPEQKIPETNLLQVVKFDKPTTNAPFGEIVFQDPTFLPGTVMFNFWGHGVELTPRILVINNQAVNWQSNTNIPVTGEGKFERRPVKKPFIL
jgi:hypothetical protein